MSTTTMAPHTRHLARVSRIAAPLALATASACAFFIPLSYENLGETRVRAICHFAFACCTPIERQLFANAPLKDEGACVAESLEDEGFGFLLNIDAQAKDAVARGTAEYDSEAAARCSQGQLDAVNQCDVEKLVDSQGTFDFTRFLLLADASDPECAALASRNYVRGNVGDGDECLSSFDCESFGICIDEDDEDEDGEVLTSKGKCLVPHAEGDECDDGNGCQPGLVCIAEGGATPTCEQVDPLGDGEPCSIDSDCESGNCQDTIGAGSCFDTDEPCVDDVDCEPGDFCNGEFIQECAAAGDVSIEICDGQQ